MNNDENHLSSKRIIYIMGTARSGTTILEILLAHAPNVFGAGELTNLIRDGFINGNTCSCRLSSFECEIWKRVKDEMNFSNSDLKEFTHLQKKIDWHTGFVKQLFGAISYQEIESYRSMNRSLLDSIRKVSLCGIILDSSKFSGRALALKRFLKADVSVICLTRSPVGIMDSFQKQIKDEQQPKSPLSTMVYYLFTLASLRITCWILRKNVIQIRYEDLQTEPIVILKQLALFCGLDLSNTIQKIHENQAFDVGHIVTGNRLRKKGKVPFQLSKKHKRIRCSKHLFIIGIMQIWKWSLRF